MSGFPSTRRLDSFNRTDRTLDGPWEAMAELGADMPVIVDGACGGGEGFKGARYTGPIDDRQEIWLPLKAAGSGGVFFSWWVRQEDDRGYQGSYDPLTNNISISRVDGGVATILDSETYNPTEGDVVGATADESTIAVWVTRGVPTKIFEITDATYGDGTIAFNSFELGAPDLLFEEVGGGTMGADGTPPSNTDSPTIEGVAETGLTVTCDPGEWSGDATVQFDYQWLRDGDEVWPATTDTYELTVDDEGAELSCRVTGWNEAGVGQASTAAAYPIASTEGQNDTLIAISGVFVPVQMHVAVDGEWI